MFQTDAELLRLIWLPELTLELPQTAPNTLQGQRSALTYTFTAAQAGKRR